MFGIVKGMTKTAVLATASLAAVVGGSLLIAGPGRTMAMAHEIQHKVSSAIDSNLDDPIALKRQLLEVEREYPARIAEVRKDLAGLRADIDRLLRERAVANKVVEMASADLEVARPEVEGARLTSLTPALGLSTARVRRLQQIVAANQTRTMEAGADLELLRGQEARMVEVLEQLESERAQFQAQLSQLERQVDSIARNNRMITLLEKRQRTLDKIRSWEAVSLEQIQGQIASIRAEQEAELEVLTQDRAHVDYEAMARQEIQAEELLQLEMYEVTPSDVR